MQYPSSQTCDVPVAYTVEPNIHWIAGLLLDPKIRAVWCLALMAGRATPERG